ncbi:hypothetical protein LA080_014709 [Diaporthe eres]|nr:hypothetical protein LA080_014709 [Diaporthe eres]
MRTGSAEAEPLWGRNQEARAGASTPLRGALGAAFIIYALGSIMAGHPSEPGFAMNGSEATLPHPTGHENAETKFRGPSVELSDSVDPPRWVTTAVVRVMMLVGSFDLPSPHVRAFRMGKTFMQHYLICVSDVRGRTSVRPLANCAERNTLHPADPSQGGPLY